ncbi:hypothetical protein RvY_05559 [Ramazzottius varieornatus]|uniref:Uncharacterized protein n=1 Tax=Ramazzottius varieornatus TaxID=947166 RepID=A0A1D1UZ32_RAMVA|nr:hypothetical protein RvY_05559 [Ramazzottius varieornatus]
MKMLLRSIPLRCGQAAILRHQVRKPSAQPKRFQSNAAVGIRSEAHKNDEFEIIKEKTRQLLEKPKIDRQPFLKNLFIKKIDPQILEFPEVPKSAFDEIMRQVEPLAAKVLKDVDAKDVDKNSEIPDEVVAELGNSGAFVHLIPRTHYGNDMDLVGWTSLIESLSLNGNVSLGTLAYTMGSWCTRPISQFGTEEQKAFYLPQIADGKAAFSFCVSEARSGCNVASMETSVRMGPDNRGYILNGKKSWVINAEKANYFIVIAKHEGMGQITGLSRDTSAEYYKAAAKQQEGSMSAFIVSKKAPGVMVGDVVPFVGLKGLRVSEVIFEETAVSLDCLLGSVGQGFDIAMKSVAAERHVLAAAAVPLLKKLMAETVRHACERKLFNRELKEFQMIKEKLAEVAYLTYGLESMMYLTSLLIDTTETPEFDLESAAVRAFLGEVGPYCVKSCMEVFGAAGLAQNTVFEQASRDLLTLSSLDGGTDIARLYVSLSGLQYAGAAYAKNIHERNNPFNYPNQMVRNFMVNLVPGSKKKRKVFLEDYLHPNFQVVGQDVELACHLFFDCVEGLLVEYNKNMIHRQMDLRRISEMAVLIYGSFAALGRASRSYCNGIKHNQQEMNLAILFANHATQRIDAIHKEISTTAFARDGLMQTVANHMVTQQSYGVEHPLSRVF